MKAGTRKSSRTRSVIGRPTHKNNSWGRKTVISKNSIGKVRGWSDPFHNSNLGGVEKQCDRGFSSTSWWSKWERARDGGVSVVVFPSPPEPQSEAWCHRQSSSVQIGHVGRKKGSHHPIQSLSPSTQLNSLEGIIREERSHKTQQVRQARAPGAGRELDWIQWAFPFFPPGPWALLTDGTIILKGVSGENTPAQQLKKEPGRVLNAAALSLSWQSRCKDIFSFPGTKIGRARSQRMTNVKVLLLKMDITGHEILTQNSVAGTSCLCSLDSYLAVSGVHPLATQVTRILHSQVISSVLEKDSPASDEGINVRYSSLCLLFQEYVQNLLITS